MPITYSTSVVYQLTNINVDMVGGTMQCVLSATSNGVSMGTQQFTVAGQSFLNLLSTQATANQGLADEISTAIYNYATTNGLISGTVS